MTAGTATDKLFNNLAITDEGCWEYIGGRTGSNYGAISLGKDFQIGAHIIAYEYFNDESVPKGIKICHTCDNPPCCNPEHLFAGTVQDNKDDEVAKERHVHGETHGCAKLTEEDVFEIRGLIGGGYSLAQVGRQYGVTTQAIYLIKTGKNWGWLR